MAEGPNMLVCRLSIFSVMVAAVVTLLYLAPVPDQSFKNCDRPCHELDWPMICRFKLIIEKLPTSVICQNCHNNQNCSFCSSPNDLYQEIMTANRQLPAPPIHVCHNDIIIVDVINKLQGQSITMHWRGQSNLESPFMDGVPLVTQCPIGAYTTFQYKLRASSAGTHSYHAFSDSDRSSGLFGALIVRKPERLEENRDNFYKDNKNHTLVLSQSKDSILINGVGPSGAPLSIFRVTPETRYRFRVIYVSGSGCPVTITLDNHLLKVIAIEGNPIKPQEVYSIKLTKGETLDFVLTANQSPSSYFINVRSQCKTKELVGKALIDYEGTCLGNVDTLYYLIDMSTLPKQVSPKKKKNTAIVILDTAVKAINYSFLLNYSHLKSIKKKLHLEGDFRKFDTGICKPKNGKICLANIENVEKMDEQLKKIYNRLYLGFEHVNIKKNEKTSSISPSNYYRTNNISFIFPPSPMLTQPTYIPVDQMCNESYFPERCKESEKCDCVHLEHIPLGSTTEIILFDQGGGEDEEDGYIFHLHGHDFYVVGSKILEKPIPKSEVEELDANFDFIKRNLENPIKKSTVRVPKNGIVAIRFLANNPGFWILRDENSGGWTRGLDVLFQVGDTGDIVEMPTEFPLCGNFIGEIVRDFLANRIKKRNSKRDGKLTAVGDLKNLGGGTYSHIVGTGLYLCGFSVGGALISE